MERRVVITGLGAVTPIGNDVDTFWENLKAGKCGITKITKFDSTDFKAHVAAEVKDFDPLLYMDKGEVRKNDPFSQFAIAAATQAVNDSEIMGKIDPERFRHRRHPDVLQSDDGAERKGSAPRFRVLYPDAHCEYRGRQHRH